MSETTESTATDAPIEPTIEPAAPAAGIGTAPAPVSSTPRKGPQGGWWWGTGRRKAAVARVRVKPGGSGAIVVNGKPIDEFFCLERDRADIRAVLQKTRTEGTVEVHVTVTGGGTTGQAGAIVLGVARALNNLDPNHEPVLRDNHFLTRDPRKVERKKYGQRGARRRFQFSKR